MDGGHRVTDGVVAGVTWFGVALGRKEQPFTEKKTLPVPKTCGGTVDAVKNRCFRRIPIGESLPPKKEGCWSGPYLGR